MFPYFCPLTREEFERHIDDKEITDILSKFQIDDPYEICFTGRFSCLRHLWPSEIVGRAEKPFTDSSRTLLYTPVYAGEKFGAYEQGERLNAVQLVFKLSGAVLPRNYHPFERERKIFLDAGMDPDEQYQPCILLQDHKCQRKFRFPVRLECLPFNRGIIPCRQVNQPARFLSAYCPFTASPSIFLPCNHAFFEDRPYYRKFPQPVCALCIPVSLRVFLRISGHTVSL